MRALASPREGIAEWLALKPGPREGYVDWERAEAIRRMVSENVPTSRHHGAAKHGDALLAGLIRCRRCGRKLTLSWDSRPESGECWRAWYNPTSKAPLRHLPSHVTSTRISVCDFRRWFFELRWLWFVPVGCRQLAAKEEAIAPIFSRVVFC
jgi:hypothetical protein